MALPENDLFLNRGELADRELSIEELDAIAAGNWLGDAWRWVKNEAKSIVNDKITEYKAYAGLIVETGRALREMF